MSLPSCVTRHFDAVREDRPSSSDHTLDLRRYAVSEDGSAIDRVLDVAPVLSGTVNLGEFVSCFEGLPMLSPEPDVRVCRLDSQNGLQLALTSSATEQPTIFVQATRSQSSRDFVRVELHGDLIEVDHWHYSSNESVHVSMVERV
ncbi:MAG: hypothetical protein AB7S38_10030 [Vulcanimicrobiota bacterium]